MNESDLIDHKRIFFHICKNQNSDRGFCSSEVYKVYFDVCKDNGIKPYSNRMLRIYLTEFCEDNKFSKFSFWNTETNRKDSIIKSKRK